MAEPDTQRDPVEALAADFLERQRRGESPSVEEYAASHPLLAEEIREVFPTLAAVERLKARGERTSGGLASLGPVRLERLGDFRIVREIGRGGMGIVFEAEQESLGRRVALKVLPRQALLERRHLARFRREARIASRLHHTNIVQVYDVGEQEGFHYYAMQYVRGVGLERAIARLRQWQGLPPAGDAQGAAPAQEAAEDPVLDGACRRLIGLDEAAPVAPPLAQPEYYRRAASIAVQAAEALAYAHGQGAIHRDVKPSNLLLDDQAVAWVTDFGLARADHAPDITQPGDLTGTLRYLPPERFHGQADERGDVYSLGLTLYELLTLRPAYDEADRSALIHRVSQGTPAAPRRLNPAIPRDLETVVLKAVAREPAHRYATAGALADDLRRFLEDRPVQARRIGIAERTWRWCRRNRAVAALAAATGLLVVAVAVVATAGYVRTRGALAEEALQRRRAEAVAALAGDALDRVFERLGPLRSIRSTLTLDGNEETRVEIVGQPALSQQTAALLEEMLPFYGRLAEQTGDDPGLRKRSADAKSRIGDIRLRLGQFDQAVDAYHQAIDLYRPLAAASPGEAAILTSLAAAYNELGRSCLLARKTEDSRQAHLQALDILRAVASDASPSVRFERARTYYFLGSRPRLDPGLPPPGPGAGRGAGLGAGRGPFGPRSGPVPDRPAMGPARPPPQPGRFPGLVRGPGADAEREARNQYLEQAVALLDGLRTEQPASPEYRHLLALCYREMETPRRSSGPSAHEKAAEILEGLVRDFPQAADYRFDLCQTYAMGTWRDVLREGAAGAEDRLKKALALAEELVLQNPNVPEYRAARAQVLHGLGEVLRRAHRLDDAEKRGRQAVEIQAALAREFPEVATYGIALATFRNSLAQTLLLGGKASQARPLLEENIATTGQLLQSWSDLWFLRALLMDAHRTLAAVLRKSGEPDRAAQADRDAEGYRRALPGGPWGRGPDRPTTRPR